MGTNYGECRRCGAHPLKELERIGGIARVKCRLCGRKYQQIVYLGKAVGLIDGWYGFYPEKTETPKVREMYCAEHNFTAKSGPQWGAHKRYRHGKPKEKKNDQG